MSMELLREVSRSSAFLSPLREICSTAKLFLGMSELSAFYTLLLRKRVAMPHMVQVGYTTQRRSLRYTQPRACGPRVYISRRDLHLVV